MDADNELQEPCCAYAIADEPICPCSFCGGCYAECHGDCEPDTSEVGCDCRPGMLCGCKYQFMSGGVDPSLMHHEGVPECQCVNCRCQRSLSLASGEAVIVLPEHQGGALVGNQGGQGGEPGAGEEREQEPAMQEGDGMEVEEAAAGNQDGYGGNWVETMTEQQKRKVMQAQAGASVIMNAIEARGILMDMSRDRVDHPAVTTAAMTQLLQVPKVVCDLVFTKQVIVQITAMAHMRQSASQAPFNDPCLGLSCSVHGLCNHIADGCFQDPPMLLSRTPTYDTWWNIPGIMQHMDLGDVNSMVSVVFTWGLYPSMHIDHFLRAVRLFKRVYYIMMPEDDTEDAAIKRRWCQSNVAELMAMERGYDPGHHQHSKQQLQALFGHLCPECPQIAPRARITSAEATNLRRDQQRLRIIRVREIVGEQLAAKLLFLEPAAAGAAADPDTAALPMELAVAAPVVDAAGDGADTEPAAEEELVGGGDWGPPIPRAQAEANLQLAAALDKALAAEQKAEEQAMWSNIWGAAQLVGHYLTYVCAGDSRRDKAIIGWWCNVRWEMFLVKVGSDPVHLSMTQFQTYSADMYLGCVHRGGLISHPANPEQVLVDLSAVFHSFTRRMMPGTLV